MERITCAAREPGMSINLTDIMLKMLNPIIFWCSLGDNFNKDYVDSFVGLFNKATTLMESMCFEDFFPLLKWVDVLRGFEGKLKRTSQELDTFLNRVIDDHVSSEEHRCKDDKMNFIDLLLLHAEDDNLNLSRDSIKGIIMDMFVGGSDTPATAIEWSMEELIKNPRLMKKAQEKYDWRRGCPGMAFGLAVMEFLLANLLYQFNWEFPGGANSEEFNMTEGFGLTVNRKMPLHVVPILFHPTSF
ncbi:cytochrome P450 71A1-like [Papaver somniferum]|uniref:cytochrome P450 71A1-like n=1 Tax=Papaver somniferum TaxID=3469 RepID=UPI000E6FA2F9|nr:cytochrome P450 71A1-like [Papaver somniferum]